MAAESHKPERQWLDAIRRDWDTPARENARAYIDWIEFPRALPNMAEN